MKKALCALTIIISIALSGCGGSVWANYRPVEALQPVEAVGFDRVGQEVELTVTAPMLRKTDVPLLTARGREVETAAAALEQCAGEETLFFSPVRFALLGREAGAQEVEELFHWFTHSGRSRLDLPVLMVRNESPRQLMEGVEAAGQKLSAVTEKPGVRPVTLLDRMAQLRRGAAALCPAVDSLPLTDHIPGAPAEARQAQEAGYAVIRSGEKPVFLTEAESMGAALLGQKSGTLSLTLPEGIARVTPLWCINRWEGDRLHVTLLYVARLPQTPAMDREAPEAAMEEQLTASIEAVLARAAEMEADFLQLTDDGVFPAGATWNILVRGRVLPPAGEEAQA